MQWMGGEAQFEVAELLGWNRVYCRADLKESNVVFLGEQYDIFDFS